MVKWFLPFTSRKPLKYKGLRVCYRLLQFGGPDGELAASITASTDGNLGAQLLKLEDMGYLVSKKEFVNRKPRTSYRLTEFGITTFKEYVQMLEDLLKNSQC